MIALALFVLAFALGGHVCSEGLWRREAARARSLGAPSALERIVSATACALALTLVVDWGLGYAHLLRRGALLACAAVVGALAIAALLRRRRPLGDLLRAEVPAGPTLLAIALLTPIALWVVFVLWRSSIVPVLSHDGLNYHMPKAVLMMRAHGVGYFDDATNVRISAFPNNYELLLADILELTGSDAVTEWPSTAFYVLFLLGSGALARRFWGPGLHVLAAPLLAGGAPVVLYHAGAHKNDLMTCALTVASALWVARWIASGEFAAALLALLCVAMGAGTKFPGLFVAVAVAGVVGASVVLRRGAFVRTLSRGELAALAAAAVAAVFLLGGVTYLENLRYTHSLSGPPGESVMHPGYGRWSHLWQVPVLALIVPFSRTPVAVWVPWRAEYWWWPEYDWYFSHYGVAVTFAAVAMIAGVLRYRKTDAGTSRPIERRAASAVLTGAFLVFLPAHMGPTGWVCGYPRMLAFIVPLVACWSVVPIARELGQRAGRAVVAQRLLLGALTVALGYYVIMCGTRDAYIPLGYLAEAVRHPGLRFQPCNPNRAGSVVDTMAGPDDVVAVDGDFDTNVYPVYGASLSRRVEYLPPGTGLAEIPADARWVIVDRSWNTVWNNPAFTDMGKGFRYLFRGHATDDDLRVFRQLKQDPRFVLVYRDERANQAIFVRADSVPRADGRPAPPG